MFHRLVAAALVAGIMLVPTPAQASTTCETRAFPVTVAGLQQTMAGTLCVPSNAHTLQIVVPGGFYNRSYWDIALAPRSFRLAMNNAGYATLAIDRIGSGASSVPPSALLTGISQADAVHQVVTAMRPRFAKIILGGHSLGSAIAMIEAGTYHDVDGVLVTSLSHHLNLLGTASVATTFVPAILDPAFGNRQLDPGYLTTMAGTRYSMQQPGPNMPAAVSLDETTKDVSAATELVDSALLGTVIPYTRLIDVPVLSAVGSADPMVCGLLAADCSTAAAYLASEAPFYGPAAKLATYVLPGFGHSINYAPNSSDLYAAVVSWANRMVGR
jgi:pimeloyl-ACP methyl ester carboxylesterase